jgi:hypothetical protein
MVVENQEIRKLSARLDYQNAKVDLDRGVVKVILRDRWYTLKLRHRREYVERFRNLRWKEVHVKYEIRSIIKSETAYNHRSSCTPYIRAQS